MWQLEGAFQELCGRDSALLHPLRDAEHAMHFVSSTFCLRGSFQLSDSGHDVMPVGNSAALQPG